MGRNFMNWLTQIIGLKKHYGLLALQVEIEWKKAQSTYSFSKFFNYKDRNRFYASFSLLKWMHLLTNLIAVKLFEFENFKVCIFFILYMIWDLVAILKWSKTRE